jgi:hypothetical protein
VPPFGRDFFLEIVRMSRRQMPAVSVLLLLVTVLILRPWAVRGESANAAVQA